MTIASAFNSIAVAQGGTANTSGTISGAIDALNDALAGSDQQGAQTIEQAVLLLGEHIGGGGGGTYGVKGYAVDVETMEMTELSQSFIYPCEVVQQPEQPPAWRPDYSGDSLASAQVGTMVALDPEIVSNDSEVTSLGGPQIIILGTSDGAISSIFDATLVGEFEVDAPEVLMPSPSANFYMFVFVGNVD